MKNRYGLIYEDAMKLIKKHETRDPELILKNRNVKLLPFTGQTHALGMYVVIKRNRFVFYNPSIDDNFKRSSKRGLNSYGTRNYNLLHALQGVNTCVHSYGWPLASKGG